MTHAEMVKKLGKTKNDEKLIKNICNEIKDLEPKAAKEIYEYLIEYAENNSLYKVYPLILYYYSWTQYDIGNFHKSIRLNKKVIELYKKQNNVDGMLCSINFLIGLYSNCQKFYKAIKYAKLGIELAEKTDNYQKICDIKSNLAIVYLELEEYETAKGVFEQVLKLPNVGSKNNEISNLVNLSECEIECKCYESALKNAKNALELAEKFSTSVIPYIFFLLGRIYTETENFNLAEENFKRSVQLSIEGEYKLFLYDALIFWSDLDLRLGRYDEVINKLLKIEEGNITLSSIRNMKRLFNNLSEAYKSISNYEKALYYMEKLKNIEIDFYKTKIESVKNINVTLEKEENKTYKILYDETEKLYSIGKEITANLKRENIYRICEKEMKNLFQYDFVQISIANGRYLESQLCIELNVKIEMDPISLNYNGLGAYAFNNKQHILINDIEKDYCKYIDNYNELIKYSSERQIGAVEEVTQSMIFVPIMNDEEAIGVITIQSFKKNMYDLKDVNKLKILATYLGIALQNSQYYREIKYNATYDSLTRILNRRTVLKISEEIYLKLKTKYINDDNVNRNSKVNSYVIMIDIDNFKKINDNYGHQSGDDVISAVASSIKESIGEDEIVGRYGGEEFIVVINRTESQYKDVAENIRKNIEEIRIQGYKNNHIENINVTASIGVAVMNPKSNSLNDIINRADKCLYEAKNTGKNKVVFYDV